MTNGKGRTKGLDGWPGGRYDRNRNRDAALTEAATRGRAQSCLMAAVRASIGAAKRVRTEDNRHHHQNDCTS
jgi:hypothetical protein